MKKEDIISVVPLLPAQQFMLSASMKDDKKAYVQQLLFEVRNHLGSEVEAAVDKVVQSYECLQSIILHEGLKQPVWVCLKNLKPEFQYHRIDEILLDDFCNSRISKGFVLEKETAIRLDFLETNTKKTFLLITYHHILFDGWGRQKILRDVLFSLKFPHSFLSVKSNKNWYDAWKNLNHKLAVDVYKNYLKNYESYARLSTLGNGIQKNLTYTTRIKEQAVSLAARNLGLTNAEFILFSWACFLSRWTNTKTLQLGLVKQNGLIELCRDGFGLGIQTLPFQLELDFSEKISQILDRFKQRERAVSAYPFVDTANDIFHHLQYDFLMAYENYPLENSLKEHEQSFTLVKNYDFSEFPLSLAISPKEGYLVFDWHFNQKFHNEKQVESIADHFIAALDLIWKETDSVLGDISFWAETAIPEFNSGISSEQFFATIEKKIEKKGRIDIYRSLIQYFNNKNIKRIWIYGDKHPLTDILICAAWRAAVETLTLNEKESADFIHKLEEKHPADLIFVNEIQHPFDFAVHLDNLGQLPETIIPKSANSLGVALSVCTSGSAGEPKVVQLSLQNLIGFFESWEQKLPWREFEHFGIIAHPAFDIGIAELIFPLWKGWNSTIIDKKTLSESALLEEACKEITAFHMVPSLLERWIETMPEDQLCRLIMTGGDKVPQHLARKLHDKFPNSQLFQFYGPSECSVLSTGFENTGQFDSFDLPLGTSFSHAHVFISNENNCQAAPFQEGEIIVCGPAVGMGYAEQKKEEKFFIYKNTKAYKTGDLGFYNSLGQLFFRGRKDNQIKINGQRIEISRIEFALKQWSGIEHWVVLSNENCLIAFAKAMADTALAPKKLLQQWLPLYAIPQIIECMPEFPLNKNGKVDLQKLMKKASEIIKKEDNQLLDYSVALYLKELFPTKTINPALSWYANGLNSIDALKFSGMIKTKSKVVLEINSILEAAKLSDISEIKNNINTELIGTFPVQVGQKVYSTAARILFLSESDELFFQSYWISSGILFQQQDFLKQITEWIHKQQNLHFAIETQGSNYIWKRSNVHIFDIEVQDAADFENFVENKYMPIHEGLFQTCIGRTDNEFFLAFKIHHALLDGLGIEQLWRLLHKDILSKSFTQITLSAPKEQKTDTAFWKSYLHGIETKLLPFERKNNYARGSGRLEFRLKENEIQQLQHICRNYNCSLFEACLVLWVKMWYSYFEADKFATGIPVNIGEVLGENILSAMSVNIVPYKVEDSNPQNIINSWRLLFAKRFEPFAEIAQLDDNEQKSGLPFFNTTYLYHAVDKTAADFKTLKFNRSQTDYHISLDFIHQEDNFTFSWEYRTDLFTEQAISKFQEKLFSTAEKVPVQKKYPEPISLKSRWQLIIEKYASKTAIFFENRSLSYFELNQLIDKYSLIHNKDANEVEVLTLDRSPESVAQLLYFLIEAKPFVPVDIETVEERIIHIRDLASKLNRDGLQNNLQYAIATSGTTGLPKLVGVTKDGFTAAVSAWISDYNIHEGDICLQAASFSFDVSLGDLGRSFFNGAGLVLLNAWERKDPSVLLDKIKKFEITVFETTPLIIRWWIADAVNLSEFPSLRLLIVGSDSWKMKEIRALQKTKLASQKLISSYGLSETTIDNSFFDIDTDDRPDYADEMTVPIGNEMSNCAINVFSDRHFSIQDGMDGFVGISGPAVGYGYYIQDNWTNKQALVWYTADRGTKDEWGILHFKGRSDKQVKIRGQRVELEEIENILTKICPDLNWHAVDTAHGLSTEIAAFYSGNMPARKLIQIKKEILQSYPSYFLPSLFIEIEKVPLNQNGKTDMETLRKIALSHTEQSIEINSNEEILAQLLAVYRQCFEEDVMGNQHFFHSGKNSFDAMQYVRRWNEVSDKKMAVFQLFSAENFKQLSQSLEYQNSDTPLLSDRKVITKAQEAIWYEIKRGNSSLYNLPHFITIPDEFGIEKTKIAFKKSLQYCSSLFVKFHENAVGEVFEIPLDANDYELPELHIDNFEDFSKQAFLKELVLTEGPAFEAAIIHTNNHTYLYFNPHHLVYDGGSDGYLREIFLNFYLDKPQAKAQSDFTIPSKKVDWKSYFSLTCRPAIYFSSSQHQLQPSLVIPCTSKEREILQQIIVEYQTTQTVIISNLLSKALHLQQIKINWISLVVDHRTKEQAGMHMRAYPFPAFDPEVSTDDCIASQKWALSQLFAASEQAIIYPDTSIMEAYHQVGLIIQHPFILENNDKIEEKTVMSRPRLPLSLYVEQINTQLIFRWEFDHQQINQQKIRELHQNFFLLALELSEQKKQCKVFIPETDTISTAETAENYPKELMSIWVKYLGKQNSAAAHFFEAGGNSIKALLLLKELEKSMQIKISAADFFRQPTLSFINRSLKVVADPNLIWKIKEQGSGPEIWLVPPIMGLSFIFNSLKLPEACTAFAFSYPGAYGQNRCSSIEEIAILLIKERIRLGALPREITILGYSMGALVAFEMAKWLEENEIRVKKLIILDKTAQPEPGKIIQNIELKMELLDIAAQISTDNNDYERIVNYLKDHQQYIESYQQSGTANADLDVYYCENGFSVFDFLKWQIFSKKRVLLHKIKAAGHYEIPAIWNELEINFEN